MERFHNVIIKSTIRGGKKWDEGCRGVEQVEMLRSIAREGMVINGRWTLNVRRASNDKGSL